MKMHAPLKSKGMASRVNNQHVIFELKQRVVLALNKIADRDTYEIGVEELGKTIESLTPDGVSPFLSCILDTDSEQKIAVRKECIRLMGMLATFHQDLIGPYLGKMVASIVKRLKDPDSVVREACIETMGVLASKASTADNEPEGSFVLLVRPLFEALGEQNKHVQCGSALCLSRVIDHTHAPPLSILQRMLTRTIKMLKNPHFMAKPAMIELNRSFIQAGGASTQSMLTAAITGIQEALKNSDWRTRKAASEALAEIASSNGLYSGSLKSSCIRSLEMCRFDKVKPVRDTVLHALQLWRSLVGTEASELSEAGSSIKGDFSDIPNTTESTLKTKIHHESVRKRVPPSVRKTGRSYVESPQHSKANDWHIEVSVPKTCNIYTHDEESEGSSVTKTFERTRSDITSTQDIGYEYVPMDDKQEFSSASNIDTGKFGTNLPPVTGDSHAKSELVKSKGVNQHQAEEEISTEEQRYFSKSQDRRSLDSTITESSSETMHGQRACCMQTAKEMAFIREKLLEIETKQSSLLDLLQVFATRTMDSLSMIQLKVLTLEDVVDQISEDMSHGGRRSESTAKFLKKSSTTASPRLSTCTPRSSVDIRSRQSPLQPMRKSDTWEDSTSSRSKAGSGVVDSWMDPMVKVSRNPAGKDMQKNSSGLGNHRGLNRNGGAGFAPTSFSSSRHNNSEVESKLIKGYLSKGDLDSAYVEALNSGDELVLVDLLDKTGPVLESLSNRTANDILTTLASFLTEQQFMTSTIPWLQQAVELSSGHGPNQFVLTAKARRQLLGAIQEAVNMEFPNAMERRSVAQLVSRLHQVWGKQSTHATYILQYRLLFLIGTNIKI
ncbi:TORTIFOLIA1-like protein 2 [Cynara cardunculus var. scolymus]|uniref:TORTIFOLIA1-like protein 2 n=1 Tax=Cynara cardunculus var. scolymus TaxID=59895 RepID=UPI000D63145E|nr:TORTIFOLIA1-like protein 2 [Cynara cardunculus var. scolymus]